MLALSLSDKFCYFGIFVFVFDFFVFVFVNEFIIFSFFDIFVFVFVNENHTASGTPQMRELTEAPTVRSDNLINVP